MSSIYPLDVPPGLWENQREMKARFRILLGILIALAAIILIRLLIGNSLVALLTPQGTIASQERDVIVYSILAMLVVAIPMLILLYTFAWRYRADNTKATYEPERVHSPWAEAALWVIPAAVVVVIGMISWQNTPRLDPYASIPSSQPPLTIQVIALRWKWLFIYPDQHIATVNQIVFPEQRPVHFELTADAPMSSFWIPQLGSQIYAMAAMQTQLSLMASSTGEYLGRDTEINGAGYAGMTFTAKSVTSEDFDAWVHQVQRSSGSLDRQTYATLVKPSTDVPPAVYTLGDPNLYGWVLTKDMMPDMSSSTPSDQTVPAPMPAGLSM